MLFYIQWHDHGFLFQLHLLTATHSISLTLYLARLPRLALAMESWPKSPFLGCLRPCVSCFSEAEVNATVNELPNMVKRVRGKTQIYHLNDTHIPSPSLTQNLPGVMRPSSCWVMEDLIVSLYHLWIRILVCLWHSYLLIIHGFDLFPSEMNVCQGLYCVLLVKVGW